MKTEIVPKKKYSIISYLSLLIGIMCFFIRFYNSDENSECRKYSWRLCNDYSDRGRYYTFNNHNDEKNREEGDSYYFINTVLIIFYILDYRDYLIAYWSNKFCTVMSNKKESFIQEGLFFIRYLQVDILKYPQVGILMLYK